jgi:hypothetical protein
VQASVRVVETFDVPTSGAASVGGEPPATSSRRRIPQRAIEFVGIVIGIALVAAVARAADLSNDEFWSLATGQWMLAHHAFMGLDPFSYTESHRRWVTDEWGSEIVLASLFRTFGNAAYSLYAIVLGGLCLITSAAYARSLGARGGRVVVIVILLAVGIAGVVAGDRGLDFSLVWLPLELLLLAKARANPRWLLLLPVLCLLWVNTHGSILLGLFVLAVELGWSLIPERFVQRIGGIGQTPYTGSLALVLLGSVLASCITPYGPGLLAYDAAVARNGQIARFIVEWGSPNFHSVMTLLLYCVPLAVLVACFWTRRLPLLEVSLGLLLLVEALQAQRFVVYLVIVAAGMAATLPARAPWGARARLWAGGCLVVLTIVVLAIPAVPAGQVASSQPVAAFNYLSVHPGRIFTQYTWGDYSVARHRATFVDGRTDLFEGRVLSEFMAVTNLTTNPDPVLSASHVSYVVWAPDTPLALYLDHDPRWHVVDRTPVALVFARR